MEVMVSLNNVLDFINSMSLSANNKRWLASKLIEEAKEQESTSPNDIVITRDDLRIDPEVSMLFNDFQLSEDYSVKEDYADYLSKKYK